MFELAPFLAGVVLVIFSIAALFLGKVKLGILLTTAAEICMLIYSLMSDNPFFVVIWIVGIILGIVAYVMNN